MSERDKPSLGGMTVNERLVVVGIIDRWDEAVRRRDRNTMIELLEQVEVRNPHLTVDAVLANPQKVRLLNQTRLPSAVIGQPLSARL